MGPLVHEDDQSLEGLLESHARIKILKILARHEGLSVSQIVKITRLNSSIVEKHLDHFLSKNLIETRISDRIKLYISKTKISAKSLKTFLHTWEGDL